MDPKAIAELQYFTYGDVLDQSWRLLTQQRDRLRSLSDLDHVPPRFPTHIQIQTIAGCNASCAMCPMSRRDVRKHQKGRMRQELFEKIVKEAAAHEDCAAISPYLQNEPLLDENLADRVRDIKTLSDGRLSARIVTNGFLLDERRTDGLLDAGIDVISISLNAHRADTYRATMGGLELETTLENIERLLARKLPNVLVVLTFMVTSLNEKEIEEAVAYWSARGVMCGAYGVGTMGGEVANFSDLQRDEPARDWDCFVPLEAVSILSSGDVLLCCSDWSRATTFDNVANTSVYDIWHSAPAAELRRDAIAGRFEHPVCKKCLGQTKNPSNLIFEGGPARRHDAA